MKSALVGSSRVPVAVAQLVFAERGAGSRNAEAELMGGGCWTTGGGAARDSSAAPHPEQNRWASGICKPQLVQYMSCSPSLVIRLERWARIAVGIWDCGSEPPSERGRRDSSQPSKKKGASAPRLLPPPLRQGTGKQNWADAPYRERGPVAAIPVQESKDSRSQFGGKQKLDAHASLELSVHRR
jgi:hypothetical protein